MPPLNPAAPAAPATAACCSLSCNSHSLQLLQPLLPAASCHAPPPPSTHSSTLGPVPWPAQPPARQPRACALARARPAPQAARLATASASSCYTQPRRPPYYSLLCSPSGLSAAAPSTHSFTLESDTARTAPGRCTRSPILCWREWPLVLPRRSPTLGCRCRKLPEEGSEPELDPERITALAFTSR